MSVFTSKVCKSYQELGASLNIHQLTFVKVRKIVVGSLKKYCNFKRHSTGQNYTFKDLSNDFPILARNIKTMKYSTAPRVNTTFLSYMHKKSSNFIKSMMPDFQSLLDSASDETFFKNQKDMRSNLSISGQARISNLDIDMLTEVSIIVLKLIYGFDNV